MGISPRGVDNAVPVVTHRQGEHGPPFPPHMPKTTSGGAPSCATGPPGLMHFPLAKQRPVGQGLPVVFVEVDHGRGDGGGAICGSGAGGGRGGGSRSIVSLGGCCVGVAGTRKGDGGTGSLVGIGASCAGRAVGRASAVATTVGSVRADSCCSSGSIAGDDDSLQDTSSRPRQTNARRM